MKAIIITNNKKLIWSEVPIPVLNEGEVLVEIYAAGVNRADLMQRAGNYPPPPGCPNWPGLEIAGYIQAVSAKLKLRAGGKSVIEYVHYWEAAVMLNLPQFIIPC